MNKFSITLNNASVHYTHTSFSLRNLWDATFRGSTSAYQNANKTEALSKIDLQIHQGERIGLIGLNGAGKSTLLKVMAKIYHPTGGSCQVKGKICPLFELATGFEMDMSGWKNIQIRAKLLGMTHQEIKEKLHDIAEFTELGHFLNYPVRTYSSGMFIRLAFAVSTAISPEILLLDEVIGAGDLAFTQKASERLESFMKKGQILVLATHSSTLLEKFCKRTIWLHKGAIKMDGATKEVWQAYSNFASANQFSNHANTL